DAYMAWVVGPAVLDKGRRALIRYGGVRVAHAPAGDSGGGGVAQVEQETGQHVYVILAGGHPRLALYPRRTVIPCHGTWLESADAGKFGYMPSLFCGAPLGSLADAVLYLGQEKDQTQSLWNPAIYLDPEYWAELRRRNAIMGNHVDLAKQYRQEQAGRWPVPAGPRGAPQPRPPPRPPVPPQEPPRHSPRQALGRVRRPGLAGGDRRPFLTAGAAPSLTRARGDQRWRPGR